VRSFDAALLDLEDSRGAHVRELGERALAEALEMAASVCEVGRESAMRRRRAVWDADVD